MARSLRILHLEDNPQDAELVRELLVADGLSCTIERVDEQQAFVSALEQGGWDLILSDYSLPAFDGLVALDLVRRGAPDLPFVLLSGSLGEEAAVESVRRGATDYILKDNLTRLPTSIRRALAEAEERRLRTVAEAAHEESQKRYRRLVELSPDAHFVLAGEQISYASAAAVDLLGATSADALRGLSFLDRVLEDDRESLRTRIAGLRGGGTIAPLAVRFVAPGGQRIETELVATGYQSDGGFEIQVIVRDVGERSQLERQLRQAQKMEAIGRLAGGVAHDFNNLLTPILGYSQVLRLRLAGDPELIRQIGVIEHAATRASGLTRQLLAFSRQQPLKTQILDLNTIVSGMEPMLRRLIGAHIELVVDLAAEMGRIEADPTQIEQIVLNLAINAQDAMPGGGILRITTRDAGARPGGLPDNRQAAEGWVILSVSDNGTGISPEVLVRIFEPFFTTKESGKGTGLGLSTVHGIVQQSGGDLEVTTAPGAGTTFDAWLPRSAATECSNLTTEIGSSPVPTGTELVLVVEDNDLVREFTTTSLVSAGYRAMGAGDADEAMRLIRNAACRPDLLLTDVVLPRLSGPNLAGRIRASWPDTRVIYMSGYPGGGSNVPHATALDAPLLQKPFTVNELLRLVRRVLDTSCRDAA